ncbi:MAG: diaminopimelate epimerase [Thiotrichales bacterium 39-47-5]|nr:MAG: diaminopimelate epimerase [Thiotrichales bacterium 35-46-9]OYZ42172.1 MAG: diaminopimelate epimerase [Thiotrichales bacterium 24-47-4]OZA75389.1 MAG: diaminopimelate epimerase [Thiotrichales bacterium 39-47-5]UCG18595.1 MAG: diaminopimelate epimerase [Thiotrichales bacterium]HQR95267.1 diaminopimelate epimerase [Thiotrichales bacterium]
MASLTFFKMHGLGNDFMVFDAIHQNVQLSPEQIRRWANRYTGVGFDQLLLVESAQQAGVDFRYRIFNADGSEVAQCGNGARCFARFVREQGLSDKDELVVETASGIIKLYHEANGVRVNMGAPRFESQDIPLTLIRAPHYLLSLGDDVVTFYAVSMGNPHAVIEVDNIDEADVSGIGAALQARADIFPESVNVGFVQIVGREEVRLRVYERGSGETQACGTGASAAMAALRSADLVDEHVRVSLLGGDLMIRWSGDESEPLWMTGPAETVFKGTIDA